MTAGSAEEYARLVAALEDAELTGVQRSDEPALLRIVLATSIAMPIERFERLV